MQSIQDFTELSQPDVWQLEFDKILKPSSNENTFNFISFLLVFLIFVSTFIFFVFWILTKSKYSASLGACRLCFAFHSDKSNRSMHLRNIVYNSDPHAFKIIVLGRFSRHSLESLKSDFDQFSILIPFDLGSVFVAIPDIVVLYKKGFVYCLNAFAFCSIRNISAVIFRVSLGAVSSRWWLKSQINDCSRVVFGISGTADTSLQESAIQSLGAKTIHAMHGQSVGSNFLAYSDLAICRSKYDMNYYKKLNCYKYVSYIKKDKPKVIRGQSGVIIFSNLAHPLNADYIRNGLNAELSFISSILRLCINLNCQSERIVWKPHPTFTQLCLNDQNAIINFASNNSIQLLFEGDAIEYASKFKWVFSTPSTIVIDLLLSGILSFVLDPLRTSLETSMSPFVVVNSSEAHLYELVQRCSYFDKYSQRFDDIWDLVGPGASVDCFKKVSDLVGFIDQSTKAQVH